MLPERTIAEPAASIAWQAREHMLELLDMRFNAHAKTTNFGLKVADFGCLVHANWMRGRSQKLQGARGCERAGVGRAE